MKSLSEKELREKILDWYKNLGIKPSQKDKLLTVSVTELTRFIDQDRKAWGEKEYRKGYQAGNAQKNYLIEQNLQKLERGVYLIDRIYKYILTHPNFDLRKSLPKQTREAVGELQASLVELINEKRNQGEKD